VNRTLVAAFLLSPFALAACNRRDMSGPPNLRLGRSECAECGMIINEDRFSGGMTVERDGAVEPLLFDDIGCMLDYMHDHPELRVGAAYVHDHATRAWVAAGEAVFLCSDETKLATPMGSGIAAFAAKAVAEEAQRTLGGDLLDYPGLAPARRARMEQRYGTPNRAAPGRR
jgi:copper chaperone NosL